MIISCAFNEMTKLVWRGGSPTLSSRLVAEETAIALSYNGSSYAVMMATPADLGDFGVGFTLTEGIVKRADEIVSLDLVETDLGVEIRMWLDERRTRSFFVRRRAILGPVGCGLCGIESLEQACPVPPRVANSTMFRARDLLMPCAVWRHCKASIRKPGLCMRLRFGSLPWHRSGPRGRRPP
jgi:FdhD protein